LKGFISMVEGNRILLAAGEKEKFSQQGGSDCTILLKAGLEGAGEPLLEGKGGSGNTSGEGKSNPEKGLLGRKLEKKRKNYFRRQKKKKICNFRGGGRTSRGESGGEKILWLSYPKSWIGKKIIPGGNRAKKEAYKV